VRLSSVLEFYGTCVWIYVCTAVFHWQAWPYLDVNLKVLAYWMRSYESGFGDTLGGTDTDGYRSAPDRTSI
jgi:hypothetical protein